MDSVHHATRADPPCRLLSMTFGQPQLIAHELGSWSKADEVDIAVDRVRVGDAPPPVSDSTTAFFATT